MTSRRSVSVRALTTRDKLIVLCIQKGVLDRKSRVVWSVELERLQLSVLLPPTKAALLI